jgi:hypothetical protein
MGKAKVEINWPLFELYCKSATAQIKIAQAMGIDRDTLRDQAVQKYGKPYSAISAAFHCEGDLLLEAAMFQKALKGNVQTLIWLSKCRLGYKEPESNQNVSPLQLEIDQTHIIMELENKIATLEDKLANQ